MRLCIVGLTVLVAVASAARGRDDRDRGTGGSDRDRGSSFSGAGVDGDNFPDYFRVEVEIQRLENEKGILSNGKNCDVFGGKCDPRVQVFVDVDQPLSPWPGSSESKEYQWPQIFEASNVNSPTIGKSVTRDVCGGSVNKVNARVSVLDVDTATSNDHINNFDCVFDVIPHDVARDAKSAQWSQSFECTPKFQSGKMRLLARQRSYEIPASNCQASSDKDQRQSLSTGMRSAGPHIPGRHDFVRLDAEIVQLSNPQGITDKKVKCDTGNACDPKISVNLDTDIPLARWPGSKTVPNFKTIFQATNQDSPVVNKNITKTFCGGSVAWVNLRADVVDEDSLSANDHIGSFECLFLADYNNFASDISISDWSTTQDCKALQDTDVRLQYRYRIYDVPPTSCGIKASAK
ncbi:uncharacterized protein LOC129594164 [Paramacrobiotus metropolitanus]|uniref:uncharacterized protein LOC129594164 n=1 Tax=Paramacrobiotus metropolitanus TaxID=2943436 RepID=UPI002445A6FD|nr:uncharacterized protein LOC129594164 [Paramacrobiotus metropolitanus]